MRLARSVDRRPTSPRSETTACWRSASICLCARLGDPGGLGLGLLPHLGDDLRALRLGVLADARGLGAGLTQLGLVLLERGLGLGLGLLGLVHAALDGRGALGVDLLEAGHDLLLHDDSRGSRR